MLEVWIHEGDLCLWCTLCNEEVHEWSDSATLEDLNWHAAKHGRKNCIHHEKDD